MDPEDALTSVITMEEARMARMDDLHMILPSWLPEKHESIAGTGGLSIRKTEFVSSLTLLGENSAKIMNYRKRSY
jgi:hypothetical protein